MINSINRLMSNLIRPIAICQYTLTGDLSRRSAIDDAVRTEWVILPAWDWRITYEWTHIYRERSASPANALWVANAACLMFKKLNSGPLKVKERNSLEHLSTHDDIDLMPIWETTNLNGQQSVTWCRWTLAMKMILKLKLEIVQVATAWPGVFRIGISKLSFWSVVGQKTHDWNTSRLWDRKV